MDVDEQAAEQAEILRSLITITASAVVTHHAP
jgi:hypothetical protein